MKKNADGDKNKSKDGTGRVAMYSQFGINRAYTIEANYNMCNRLSKETPEESPMDPSKMYLYINGTGETNEIVPDLGCICRGYDFEVEPSQYYFTLKDFKSMGKEVGIALLDMINLNPMTRLRNTPLQNIRVRFSFSVHILTHLEPQDLPCLLDFWRIPFQIRHLLKMHAKLHF